ncbi:putative aquaporin-12-like [Scophthalmus maximus]|uniref:Putative aquaporin-12-like n=1 Tax=Scophthalmus maximus TaxID=52904 RepID=A0A2U9C6N5_SCOMX|nr:putative aquaporin-12-like [Scophthalmus maximus]
MSGLNASLGYFVAVVIFAASVRTLLRKWHQLGFILEFASSFMLVACWLEVQTIIEVGEWAGGLGPDVTVTMLFVVLLTHGVICGGTSGNPSLVVLKFLKLEATTLPTLLAVVSQFLGAHLGLLVAAFYWGLELTDMHMIKNLMAAECSTSLLVSLLQGFFTEFVCALIFHLVHLSLRRRSALIRVPLIAVLLTFLSHTARGFTSSFINPSLAYGLTFYCPGFTFTEYAVVYWLGSLTGKL